MAAAGITGVLAAVSVMTCCEAAAVVEAKERPADESFPEVSNNLQLAGMFQVPKPEAAPKAEPKAETGAETGTKAEAGQQSSKIDIPAWQLPSSLTWQWGYGSESDVEYRRNPDLDDTVKDNLHLVVPEINAHVIYRPTDWLETTLEVILQYEYAVQEQGMITLPNDEIQYAEERGASFLVDQAFFTIGKVTEPFQFSLGRRNFEDNRHWLFDTSMDMVMLQHKQGKFRTQLTFGREVFLNLDPLKQQTKDNINTTMLYTDYRGIEDMQLGGYLVIRDDLRESERPMLIGVRALGYPSNKLNYWTELAYLGGMAAPAGTFSAYGYDIGATYILSENPRRPNISLGYAFGSGDDPNSSKNNEFRQTGIHSNEARLGGVSELRYYGEVLSPELSNLGILTLGFGFHLLHNMTIDLVWHKYRLDEMAEELRNSEITALMNQDDTMLSKDVGEGFDIVLGVRRLFGIKRLGMDLRAGWFYPGKAFRIETDDGFRKADNGSSVYVKFWY